MGERQRRVDGLTAKAVARGVTIPSVRNRTLAQNGLEYKRVPLGVIARVLDKLAPRRMPGTKHLISEASAPASHFKPAHG